MIDLDRLSFFNTAVGLAATAALATGMAAAASAQPAAPPAPGKLPPHEIKPLPLDPQKIKGVSERILVSHYENNYVGAVKRLNSIADQLASLD